MRQFAWLAVILGAFVGFALPPCPPPEVEAIVLRVVDGDTIVVRIVRAPEGSPLRAGTEETLRYIGVEAPEPQEPLGLLAAELNRMLVGGRTVYLELDEVTRDAYGRLLAYVYLDPNGNLMVNLILISTPIIGTKAYPGTMRYAEVFQHVDQAPLVCIPKVVISAVLPNPIGPEPDEEWIELKNLGNVPVDISGWKITDGEGWYTIPNGTVLKPGGTWRVYGRVFNPTRSRDGLFLANSGDCVFLYDAAGALVDRCCWTKDPGSGRSVICH